MSSVLNLYRSAFVRLYHNGLIFFAVAAGFAGISFSFNITNSLSQPEAVIPDSTWVVFILQYVFMMCASSLITLCSQSFVLSLSLGVYRQLSDLPSIFARPFTTRLLPVLLVYSAIMSLTMVLLVLVLIAQSTPILFIGLLLLCLGLMSYVTLFGFAYLDLQTTVFGALSSSIKVIRKIQFPRLLGFWVVLVGFLTALVFAAVSIPYIDTLPSFLVGIVIYSIQLFAILCYSELYCAYREERAERISESV